jgi:hypothetical protein
MGKHSWRGKAELPNNMLREIVGKWDVGNHVECLAFLCEAICRKLAFGELLA